MDGRSLWCVGLGLVLAAGGCTHLGQSKRDDEVVHKAATYEAFANFKVQSAFSPDVPPAQQQAAREEAKQGYLKAIETDKTYLPAYLGLARVQQACEDHAGAVVTFRAALQLAPKEAGLWHELGLCQCRQKSWADAIASLQKACELSPGNTQYQTTLGYTYGRAGKFQEGFQLLAQATGEAKAHYDMARLLKHMNHPTYAKQQAELALNKDPAMPGVKEFLAELDGKAKPAVEHKAESPIQQTSAAVPATAGQQEVVQAAVNTLAPPAEMPEVKNGPASTLSKPVRMPPLPVIAIRGEK